MVLRWLIFQRIYDFLIFLEFSLLHFFLFVGFVSLFWNEVLKFIFFFHQLLDFVLEHFVCIIFLNESTMGHVDLWILLFNFGRWPIFLSLIYFTDKFVIFISLLLRVLRRFFVSGLSIANSLFEGIYLFFILLHFFLIKLVFAWGSVLNFFDDFLKCFLLFFLSVYFSQ